MSVSSEQGRRVWTSTLPGQAQTSLSSEPDLHTSAELPGRLPPLPHDGRAAACAETAAWYGGLLL